MSAAPPHEEGEAPPRPWKTWRGLYLTVLGNLALLIVLFYAFMKFFD